MRMSDGSSDGALPISQALQVFDTWGGVLSPAMYREFSLPYLARIASELERGEGSECTPLILFGKGNATHLEALADCGTEGVGVDWLVELGEAARRTQGKVRSEEHTSELQSLMRNSY